MERNIKLEKNLQKMNLNLDHDSDAPASRAADTKEAPASNTGLGFTASPLGRPSLFLFLNF